MTHGEPTEPSAGEAELEDLGQAAGDQPAATPDLEAEAPTASEVEADLEQLVEKARERDEYLALAQRTQADFENFRKRTTRDNAAAETRGVVKLIRELLPAIDNLERALAAADEGESASQLASGIKLVQQEISQALERTGIVSFSPQGELFDPEQHEAVLQQPTEGAEPGTVVEVYQQGYRFGEVIVRPARVAVAA